LTCQDDQVRTKDANQQTDQWKEETPQVSFIPKQHQQQQQHHSTMSTSANANTNANNSNSSTSSSTLITPIMTVDAGTITDTDHVFDWDINLDSLLSLLVAKTLTQSLMEVRHEQQWSQTQDVNTNYTTKEKEEQARINKLEAEAVERREKQIETLQQARKEMNAQQQFMTKHIDLVKQSQQLMDNIRSQVMETVNAKSDEEQHEAARSYLIKLLAARSIPTLDRQHQAKLQIEQIFQQKAQ
jgi:hypothetical protein